MAAIEPSLQVLKVLAVQPVLEVLVLQVLVRGLKLPKVLRPVRGVLPAMAGSSVVQRGHRCLLREERQARGTSKARAVARR
jgi:hypothetical protein